MVTLTAPCHRRPVVVGDRDRIFFERMRPFLAHESVLAFVGFPHIPGVTRLFLDDGYSVHK